MFDKLKKKFILINMSLLTMVFVLIFGTIYITTSISMEKDLEHELKSTISNPRKPGPNFKMMSSSIIIELDSNNNVAKISSYIEIDEDILQDAINTIIKNENKQKVKYLKIFFIFTSLQF